MKVTRNALLFAAALLALSGAASASDKDTGQRVRAALDSDQYLYAEHITVTSKDGVVTLHGLVDSEWDLRQAISISSRVNGVKQVVDDLEIWDLDGRGR